MSPPVLISFGGTVSTSTAFLMSISFKSFLISVASIFRKSKLFMSEENLLLLFSTLGWFWYDLIILSMASLSFKDPSVVPYFIRFVSAAFFDNVNIVFVKFL